MRFPFLLILTLVTARADDSAPAFDIVVYGGTSGGVIAAVQAAKEGRRVILVSPSPHLGGMTTSGLGWTDLGQSRILGGLSREFYHCIYDYYQRDLAWTQQSRASYGNAGQHGAAFDATRGIASVFEPKAAAQVFDAMLKEKPVAIVHGHLANSGGVEKAGSRIVALHLADGSTIRGQVFIDASYEGDLLPGAGVDFTTGREANSTYGETVNGIQSAAAKKNQLKDGINPWMTPSDPASGLLPGVESGDDGPDGSADRRLQAYCYRMVLTDSPENRIAIEKPANYREGDYELLFRSIAAGQTNGFFKLDKIPNRKTDSNNSEGISTDFIGGNYGPDWDWTTLDFEGREKVAARHRDWQLGLLWSLQHSARVPEEIQKRYAPWGLPADEFTENGHWPHDLYVREGRRMISGVVMTQHHCTREVVAPDSIGLAAYAMDSHNVRRQVRNGMVKNEGDIQHPVRVPYPVSYRCVTPKPEQCGNLLVPWSLSASHMAFGSIRMEPVFMTLSQSCAIAAGLALDRHSTVQAVAYPELRARLLAAGQVLGPNENATALAKTLADGKERRIVFYGTSLTANGNWTKPLEAWLTATFPGKATCINAGLSGKNSAEGLARLDEKVLSQHPDTVFIEFAMNDAFRYDDAPSLSVSGARENLDHMVTRLKEHNPQVEIILQTMNGVWDSPAGSNLSASHRPELAAYYEMYRSYANEKHLLLIDHYADWQALAQKDEAAFHSAVPDGTHPSAEATRAEVLPALERQLMGD